MRGPMMRPTTSPPPPGAKGTMKRIGRAGQVSARAGNVLKIAPAIKIKKFKRPPTPALTPTQAGRGSFIELLVDPRFREDDGPGNPTAC